MPRCLRGGEDVQLYSFFNLEAIWGCVFNGTPGPLYPRERPGIHCTGGWVGRRAGLEGCRKSGPPPGYKVEKYKINLTS